MKTSTKSHPLFLPLALTIALAACGRGGTDANPTPSADTKAPILNGTVSKGIVKHGVVTATELDASGNSLAVIGNAITSADGRYQLTINDFYNGGPIELKLTLDDQSQMKCDAPSGCGARNANDGIADTTPDTVDFGEWYKPKALTMTALVAEAKDGDTIKASITPFTNLAAKRAKESATLDAAAVYSANSAVSALFGGTDILNTAPVDISDEQARNASTPGQYFYGVLSASIAALADKSNGQPDLDAALNALNAAYSDGKLVVNDQGSNDKISLKDIETSTTLVIDKTGKSDTSGALVKIKETIASDTTPTPDETAAAEATAKVKAFIGDVRTWGHTLLEQTATEATAFAEEASLANAATQGTAQFLIGPAFKATLRAIKRNLEGLQKPTGPQYSGALIAFGLGFTQGTLVNENGVVTISNAVINNTTVNMRVNVLVDGVTSETITLGITSGSFASATADVSIEAATLSLVLNAPYNVDTAAIQTGIKNAAHIDVKQGTLDMRGTLIQKQDDQGAPLPSAVTFRGGWKVTLINPSYDAFGQFVWITPKHVEQSGEISTATRNLKGTYSFDVVNADTFTPVGYLPIGHVNPNVATWRYVDTNNDGTADQFIWQTDELQVRIIWIPPVDVNQEPSVRYIYAYTNGETLRFSSYAFAANLQEFITGQYSPVMGWASNAYVNGEGYYVADVTNEALATDGHAGGTLDYPEFVLENATHWLDAETAVTFELQLAQLPKAVVSLSVNRSGYSTGNLEFRVAYGARQIIVGYEKGADANTTRVTLTNQNGVEVTLTPNTDYSEGDVMYNGKSYAKIQKLDSGMIKVTYLDGVIEIF